MSHLEEKGWFNITYISMDERSMDDLKASVDLIESITNQSGEHFKISSAMNYQSGNDYSFLDRIDDISIGLSHINHNSDDMKNMAAHRQELGLLTTIYTCTGDYPNSFTISDTAESAWTMWYSLAQNTDGFMRWSWDGWVENPLENVSYKYWEPGDPWFIYPAEKDSKTNTFYSTPRLERLKEGIRDINKAKYLMKNAPELKDDIDSLVKSLKRPNKGGNGYGSAVAASQEDRDLTISEVNRMKDGINKFAKEFISSKNENIVASPVRNFQPLEINKNNVSVAWQAPENTNGLEGYILYKDGKKIKELDSKENTYKFKGLNRHTIYNFKIAAKYSNGEISKKESITLRTTR